MGFLSHVRWGSRDVFTEAQAQEFRKLRALYREHLWGVFGKGYPILLQFRKKSLYEPAYSGTEFEEGEPVGGAEANTALPSTPAVPSASAASSGLVAASAVPPTPGVALSPSVARPIERGGAEVLAPFVSGLIRWLNTFEKRRQNRVWGKGHPNDPTNLLIAYLRKAFTTLGSAGHNRSTLAQVRALRNFLEAIREKAVFSHEPEGHGSMRVLVRNLVSELTWVEKHVQGKIALESAREQFAVLEGSLNKVLDHSLQYLFHAVAEKSRTGLTLSLLSAPAQVIDEDLDAALATREGALLKNLIQHPAMLAALFPPESVMAAARFGQPLGIQGEAEGTPFLDERGQAHPLWLSFLQGSPAREAQLDAHLRKLPLGICPLVLTEAQAAVSDRQRPPILVNFVRLHGLLVSFALFQQYVGECWKLAGFGGDQLLFDSLAESIVTLLTELKQFGQALQTTVAELQAGLEALDTEALQKKTQAVWRSNYEKAKTCERQLCEVLTACDQTLDTLLQQAQDKKQRAERLQAAIHAYKRLRGASDFFNRVRRQIGLAPQASYRGFESQTSAASEASARIQGMDAALLALLPQAEAERIVFLTQVCEQTPTTLPWSIFRGTYQRAAYLQDAARLLRLSESIVRLEQYPTYAASADGRRAIQALKSQCQAELNTCVIQLTERLHWPFHRLSIRFFRSWQHVFLQNITRLLLLESRQPVVEEVSTESVLERLSPERGLAAGLAAYAEEAESDEEAACCEHVEALWASTLEQEADWERFEAELAAQFDVEPTEAKAADNSTRPMLAALAGQVQADTEYDFKHNPDSATAADFAFRGFLEAKGSEAKQADLKPSEAKRTEAKAESKQEC